MLIKILLNTGKGFFSLFYAAKAFFFQSLNSILDSFQSYHYLIFKKYIFIFKNYFIISLTIIVNEIYYCSYSFTTFSLYSFYNPFYCIFLFSLYPL